MSSEPAPPQVNAAELARWSTALAAIARTGLAFTDNLYERERFEEVLHVAGDIKAAATRLDGPPTNDVGQPTDRFEIIDAFVGEWLDNIGEGVPGYVTPKIAVGAVVGNEDGDLLLIKRPESGVWLYPTGWADVGYSPAEVAVKEVEEETGIRCEPVSLLSVIDGQRMGFSRFAMYLLLFHCRAVGGELQGHPLETTDIGWFPEDGLPHNTAGASWWGPTAFAAIRGATVPATFDAPRDPVWRKET
jgi:ADP-ribose pyrophosphatase YjhB (NUDIX family)